MEKAYTMAEEPYTRIYARIDLDAIVKNMEAMRENLPAKTKMIGVVKTDGYGHGAVPVAKTIAPFVWGYAVATLEEGQNLRRHGIDKPILVLGSTHPRHFVELIEDDIRPAIFEEDKAELLSKLAVSMGKTAKMHIALDTGMGRIGFHPDENSLKEIEQIAKLPGIEIEGMFTHFARADEADKAFTHLQYERYQKFHEGLENAGVHIPMCHCANSAAIMELPRMGLDAARAGITVYGLYPSDEVERNMKIYPAMEIRSFITYVKEVEPGTPISYGGTFVTDRPMRIATIGAGYGDGYPRNLSGKGYVLIHGHRAPILGRVCMDQCMIDLSGFSDVKIGEEVVVIGRQGAEEITADEVGARYGTIGYEVVCAVSRRVPRFFFHGGSVAGMRKIIWSKGEREKRGSGKCGTWEDAGSEEGKSCIRKCG